MIKKMIEKETNAILDWLGENPNASKQKIDQKREQYEEKVNPVIQKVEAKSSVQDLIKEYEDKLKNDKPLKDCINKEDLQKIEKKVKRC